MNESSKAAGMIPYPDDDTYVRAVRGVLSDEEADEQLRRLPSDEGWFAFGLNLNPVTLGLVVASHQFAEWYIRSFPHHADIVMEVQGMPEDVAFEEIRKGRWARHYGT